MKKKAVAVVMTAVMALGMVSAVSVQAGIEDKTLIVGFDAEYPPYGYMDENGEYTGFDLELAQAVCDLEGWELEKKPINWDSKDMELNSGSIDCIWNGFTMNGREDDYTFSEPYVDNSQVIVVADDSGIEKLTDLAGKTVGVQAASAALDLLQSEEEGGQKELADTFGALNEFADYNTAFTELQAGARNASRCFSGQGRAPAAYPSSGDRRPFHHRRAQTGSRRAFCVRSRSRPPVRRRQRGRSRTRRSWVRTACCHRPW